MKSNENKVYKIILVGEAAVGKSTIMLSYQKGQIVRNIGITVGVQFISKKVQTCQNKQVTLNIWDTSGQQVFRSLVKNFYRGSSAVIIVYSITKLKTFTNLDFWLKEAKQYSNKNSVICVLGTHLDEQQNRQVSKYQIDEWSKRNQIDIVREISALNLDHVNKIFNDLVDNLRLNKLLREIDSHNNGGRAALAIAYDVEKENGMKKCCN